MNTSSKRQYEDDDADIIKSQDIESGKDITTDAEKTQCENRFLMIRECKSNSFQNLKKLFMKEKEQEEEKSSTGRVVVEQSPKGRFQRFNEVLGSGSQKSVYLAYDYDNGREVAWNTINMSLMTDEAISKTREEIDIMKKLKHINIISFISGFFNEEKKEVVIITELFNGGSLKYHLYKYGIPRLRVIKQWCLEILKGLKYLHELPNPIIHRDIKCDNIFINKNTGRVKIGDLGFSCILKTTDYAKTFSGTVEFCAPEVFYGKYGTKADIYSFGMTLLEMITNERPFKECDGNIISICDKATKHIMPLLLDKIHNEGLKSFIISCLQAEDKRPDANSLLNSQFLHDLESDENNYPALFNPLQEPKQSVIRKTTTSKYSSSPRLSNDVTTPLFISPSHCKNECSLFKSTSHPIAHISPPLKQNEAKEKEDTINFITQSKHKKEHDIVIQLKKTSIRVNNQANNDEVTVLLFKRNNELKGYNISFEFNCLTDTFEGVTRELQKEINLSDEETSVIQQKLKDLLSQHQINKTKEYREAYEKFNSKLQKIINEAKDILKGDKGNIDTNNLGEIQEYQKNIKLLEELIQL